MAGSTWCSDFFAFHVLGTPLVRALNNLNTQPSRTLDRKTRRTTMRNSERYLASRLGIRIDSMTGERYTPYGWEFPETDDPSAPVTSATSTSGFAYLMLALVSFTALVVLVAVGFAPKAQALSIAEYGAMQRTEMISLAPRGKRTLPLRPCDCHQPTNPQWVISTRLPVPVIVPRPGPRPVIPRPIRPDRVDA
jgi:hypothetical protein